MGNTEAKPEEDVQEQPPGIVLNSYQHNENRKHLDVAHKADSNSKSPAHAGTTANPQAEKPKRAMWDFGKAKGDDDAGSTKPGGVAVEGEKQQQLQQETKQQEGSFFKMFSGKEATGAADGKNDRGEDGSREPAGRRDAAAAATAGSTAGQQQQQKESGGSFSLKQMFGGKDSAAPAADEESAQNAAGKAESAMNGPVAKTTLPAARGRSAEKPRAAQPAAEVGADVHEAAGEAADASGKEPQGFFSFLKKGSSDMTDGAGHSGGLLRLQSVSLQEPADEGLPSDSASLSDARSSSAASAAAFGGFFRSMGGKRTATVATQTEPVQVLPIKDNPFSFRKKM
ncbi:uncharacterized protein LOC133357964 [Lethenteron reissneri]|uniref:uncharacterized protein LOC133357964 n=1 Tax=Lethenteron reissneri TaxID=7753 RepID=UPI002AB67B64|nr:uncharacterized protein LOC133357964 [Lethenteron reissneri]